jgi:hypothetical protein
LKKQGTKGLLVLKAKLGKNTLCRFKIVGLWFRQISDEHLDERLGAVSSVGAIAEFERGASCLSGNARVSRRQNPMANIGGGAHSSGKDGHKTRLEGGPVSRQTRGIR